MIVPFKENHFYSLDVQDAQRYIHQYIAPENVTALENGTAFTYLVDGVPVAIFGWSVIYPTRAVMWSVLGKQSSSHLLEMTRIAKRLIDQLPYKRLEMDVDYEFEQAHRWAVMLGFELEVPRLRCSRIDGGDCAIYSRILP